MSKSWVATGRIVILFLCISTTYVAAITLAEVEDSQEDIATLKSSIQIDNKARKETLTTEEELIKELRCPPPFFRVMSECFYVQVHHRLTWWESRDFCVDMGGDLAEPRHPGALIAVVSDVYSEGPTHFWLGASDLKTKGKFEWLSGKNVSTGWRPGQPDNVGDEDCMELWRLRYPSYGVKDCYKPSSFICEYIH